MPTRPIRAGAARPDRRRCHLTVRTQGLSRTFTGPAQRSREPSSGQGQSALIAGGVPSSAGLASRSRGPSSDHIADAAVTTAVVRRPREWPARRRRFATSTPARLMQRLAPGDARFTTPPAVPATLLRSPHPPRRRPDLGGCLGAATGAAGVLCGGGCYPPTPPPSLGPGRGGKLIGSTVSLRWAAAGWGGGGTCGLRPVDPIEGPGASYRTLFCAFVTWMGWHSPVGPAGRSQSESGRARDAANGPRSLYTVRRDLDGHCGPELGPEVMGHVTSTVTSA